jgi:hypothetical protein
MGDTMKDEIDNLKIQALGQIVAACLYAALAFVLFGAAILNTASLWLFGPEERTATMALSFAQAACMWIANRRSRELVDKNTATLEKLREAKRKAAAR